VSANVNPGPNVSENKDDGYKDVPPYENRWSGSELVVQRADGRGPWPLIAEPSPQPRLPRSQAAIP
jgi:hypothetical protein